MFNLTLVTPEKVIENEVQVEELLVPAFKGELNILPGHSPLITTLGVGVLKYKKVGEDTHSLAVTSWGYCEVHPEGVHILAETAETRSEIDKKRSEEAVKNSREQLEGNNLSSADIQKYQRKLARAHARLSILD